MFGRPESLLIFIPFFIVMIPIVRMLTKHQQRMAEIIHGSNQQDVGGEMAQLRKEVYDLKQLVHQQTIALDTLTNRTLQPPEQPLQARLEQN